MSYADVNGLSLYYAEQGAGDPLVLLHGGLGSGERFDAILPALAPGRRVIAVDLPGHGRTADIDRPLRAEYLAADVAALIAALGLERADVLGYSLGGKVALRLAIDHPERVRRLVIVSVPFRRDGNHPEVLEAMDQFSPALAEPLKQSPPGALYAKIAPRPEDWGTLIARTSEALKEDYDWTAEVADLRARTLLVFADADSVRPAHIVECFALLGGGLRDAGWDGSSQPANRLAVLPGTTHYDILDSQLLAPVVTGFLDSTAGE